MVNDRVIQTGKLWRVRCCVGETLREIKAYLKIKLILYRKKMVLCRACCSSDAASAFRLTGAVVQELLSSAPFSRSRMTRLTLTGASFSETTLGGGLMGKLIQINFRSLIFIAQPTAATKGGYPVAVRI
jgi:hypothetical protein